MASSLSVKVAITKNLVSALDNPNFMRITIGLQHFVSFSSVVCGRGNAGQTNYGCANSAMEDVIMNCVKNGKPGLCIRLGLCHVGLATADSINRTCLEALNVADALNMLEQLMANTNQGLYAIYGHSDSKNNTILSKCTGNIKLRVLQVIQPLPSICPIMQF